MNIFTVYIAFKAVRNIFYTPRHACVWSYIVSLIYTLRLSAAVFSAVHLRTLSPHQQIVLHFIVYSATFINIIALSVLDRHNEIRQKSMEKLKSS